MPEVACAPGTKEHSQAHTSLCCSQPGCAALRGKEWKQPRTRAVCRLVQYLKGWSLARHTSQHGTLPSRADFRLGETKAPNSPPGGAKQESGRILAAFCFKASFPNPSYCGSVQFVIQCGPYQPHLSLPLFQLPRFIRGQSLQSHVGAMVLSWEVGVWPRQLSQVLGSLCTSLVDCLQ